LAPGGSAGPAGIGGPAVGPGAVPDQVAGRESPVVMAVSYPAGRLF